MSIPKKVLTYLDKNKVKYDLISHKTVYTTFDLAQTIKKKINEIAKTLLVKTDKKYVLVILPGHYKLSLSKLKKFLKVKKAEIAPEKIMTKVFRVKPGAITPFGALHKIEVILDKALSRLDKVILRAGSYTESLRMKIKDLMKLEKMTIAVLGEKIENKKKSKKNLLKK